MIDLTERQVAEKRVEVIKATLIDSRVDYYLCETPYKVTIHLKKKLLQDYSKKSVLSECESPISADLITSTNSSFTIPNNASFNSSLNDSGIASKCESCEKIEKCLADTKKELVANILETKNTIDRLKNELNTKDIKIKQLESKLKNEEAERDKLKKERDTKTFQLNEKNKSFDKLNNSLDQEKKNNKFNVHKISNLEEIIKKMNVKLNEKNEELKEEKKKMKNISKKKNMKSKSIETEINSSTEEILKSNKETQTNSTETHNIEVQTDSISSGSNDTKIYNSEETQTIINGSKYMFSTIDPEKETTVLNKDFLEKLFKVDSKD